MGNDSKTASSGEVGFNPPIPRQPVVAQIAFWEGRAYLAPLGSRLDNPQAWLLVKSLEQAADRVGVEWVAP